MFCPKSWNLPVKSELARGKILTFVVYTVNVYLFKLNTRNTRKMCETCSKFTLKRPKWRQQ